MNDVNHGGRQTVWPDLPLDGWTETYDTLYTYAYPAPPGFADADPGVDEAYYSEDLGEFLLPYDAVRTADDPDGLLLAFMQTTYEAAADLGRWDRDALERMPSDRERLARRVSLGDEDEWGGRGGTSGT